MLVFYIVIIVTPLNSTKLTVVDHAGLPIPVMKGVWRLRRLSTKDETGLCNRRASLTALPVTLLSPDVSVNTSFRSNPGVKVVLGQSWLLLDVFIRRKLVTVDDKLSFGRDKMIPAFLLAVKT